MQGNSHQNGVGRKQQVHNYEKELTNGSTLMTKHPVDITLK